MGKPFVFRWRKNPRLQVRVFPHNSRKLKQLSANVRYLSSKRSTCATEQALRDAMASGLPYCKRSCASPFARNIFQKNYGFCCFSGPKRSQPSRILDSAERNFCNTILNFQILVSRCFCVCLNWFHIGLDLKSRKRGGVARKRVATRSFHAALRPFR